MELKMLNGDYVKNVYHDLESVSGIEETAQRIMMKLKGRRGGFALLPEYGSRLYALSNLRPAQRETIARQYIAEALEGENAILEDIRIHEDGEKLNLELLFRLGRETFNITTDF